MNNGTTAAPDKLVVAGLKRQAMGRANASPFPGPLKEAFVDGEIEIGPYKVRKVVAYDWVVFEAIKSPLLELIQSARQDPGAKVEMNITDEQYWETCWQFTRSCEEIEKVLAVGRAEVTKQAKHEIAFRASKADIPLIFAAVVKQLQTMWETAVKYAQEAEDKGVTTFFRDTETTPTTERAGS